MPWLFLIIALAAFLIAFTTHSVAMMAMSLLAGLAFSCIWLMSLMATRVGSGARNDAKILNPHELQRMRELADARRNQTTAPTDPETAVTPAAVEPPQA